PVGPEGRRARPRAETRAVRDLQHRFGQSGQHALRIPDAVLPGRPPDCRRTQTSRESEMSAISLPVHRLTTLAAATLIAALVPASLVTWQFQSLQLWPLALAIALGYTVI